MGKLRTGQSAHALQGQISEVGFPVLQKLPELVTGSNQQGGLTKQEKKKKTFITHVFLTETIEMQIIPNLSWWMMREMASNSTAFFALECCTFLDFGGSWALLRMVSTHSVRRLLRAASSDQNKFVFN